MRSLFRRCRSCCPGRGRKERLPAGRARRAPSTPSPRQGQGEVGKASHPKGKGCTAMRRSCRPPPRGSPGTTGSACGWTGSGTGNHSPARVSSLPLAHLDWTAKPACAAVLGAVLVLLPGASPRPGPRRASPPAAAAVRRVRPALGALRAPHRGTPANGREVPRERRTGRSRLRLRRRGCWRAAGDDAPLGAGCSHLPEARAAGGGTGARRSAGDPDPRAAFEAAQALARVGTPTSLDRCGGPPGKPPRGGAAAWVLPRPRSAGGPGPRPAPPLPVPPPVPERPRARVPARGVLVDERRGATEARLPSATSRPGRGLGLDPTLGPPPARAARAVFGSRTPLRLRDLGALVRSAHAAGCR